MQNSLINVPASCHKIVDRIFCAGAPSQATNLLEISLQQAVDCRRTAFEAMSARCEGFETFSIETFSHPKLTNYPRFRLAK